ncbi:MAG: nitronate monooxygenase [Halobacteriovoraceae bacterium]|nr:nitronate monooxygenase [Halobacteriovoraceae bacterium]
MKTYLTETFDLKLPIIQAPMFLVTNEEMLIAAHHSGIIGCIPALNYRTPEEFEAGVKRLNQKKISFGVNLIVNKSNVYYKKQLEICEQNDIAFIITSLGSPEEVIQKFKGKKTKIFCDVINLEHAKKVETQGADALIAVNSGAGGHLGNIPASVFVPLLKKHTKLPIISAGGVGNGEGIVSMLALGAEGLSIGSLFIASKESPVSEEYKKACIDYGAKDIRVTTKLSGTPCTVINTPYVQKIGTEQNAFERVLNSHKKLKKYAKMLTFYKGMKLLEKAAFSATYKTVWCAGTSIEFSTKEQSISEIVQRLEGEMKESLSKLSSFYLSLDS